MNDPIRTYQIRHENFARDLTRDRLTHDEWTRLQAWQAKQTPNAGAMTVPGRACVICGRSVPLLRRLDSTVCGEACRKALARRNRRKAA